MAGRVALHRAALPLGLLLPGRGLVAGRAGAAGRGARLHGAGADRPQLGVGLDGARPGGRVRAECARSARRRDRPQPTGAHLTLLVRDARGWRNLCRLLTLAHAHTREGPGRRERGEPSVSLEAVREHSEGLVCLTGCAAHGVHDEPTARRLLDAFGPHGLRVELQRPYARHDRARNRALQALAGASEWRAWRPATCTPTHAAARSCRTPSWRCATAPRSTPASRCGAATTATCWPPPRRWRRASPSIPTRCARRCVSPSSCAST